MTNPPETPPVNAPIQFDRAVTKDGAAKAPGVVCSMCNTKIVERYWTIGDQPTCVSCKASIQRDAANAKRPGVFAKSALFGFGAALAGAALYYAVLKLLNLEIALVAIAIGFMVGKAMRKGSNGWGGKRFQLTAAALTYFAVGMAYLPIAVEGAMSKKDASADSTSVTLQGSADPVTSVDSGSVAAPDSAAIVDSILALAFDSTATDSSTALAADSAAGSDSTVADSAAAPTGAADEDEPSAIFAAFLLFGGSFVFALILPIIYIIGSLPGGLISALIIVFGMSQAWKMTAGNDLTFHGPLTIPK